jgi:hypothetical protein
VDVIGKGCECGCKLSLFTHTNDGHCLVLKFQCQNRHVLEWTGSEKLQDGTYLVNRNDLLSGEDTEHYIELCEIMDMGAVSQTDIHRWLHQIDHVITEETNTSMKQEIVEENNHTKELQKQQIEQQQTMQQQHQLRQQQNQLQ